MKGVRHKGQKEDEGEARWGGSEMRVKVVRHRGQKESEGWGKSEMSMKGGGTGGQKRVKVRHGEGQE